jgi:hypothetical protein
MLPQTKTVGRSFQADSHDLMHERCFDTNNLLKKDKMHWSSHGIIVTIMLLSGSCWIGYSSSGLAPARHAIPTSDIAPSSKKPPKTVPIEISIELEPSVIYKPHRIPLKIIFTSKLSSEQDLLLITDKNSKRIESFHISCKGENERSVSSFAGLPWRNPDRKIFNHVKLKPGGKYEIKIELSDILSPRLKPGKYRLELEYMTEYGENCWKNVIKAKTALLEINGPDNIMKEGYISRKQAFEIAKKENTIKYDWWGTIYMELDEGKYVVTFPIRLPKNSLGPDYASQIVIDAKTGEVISRIMGN